MRIRQNNMRGSSPHSFLDLGLNAVQPVLQTLWIINRKRTVNRRRTIAEILHHRPEATVRNKRAIQRQNFSLATVLVQHILKISEPRLQAHHPKFAQTIDRRVRHLRKILPEEMA